MMGIFPEAGIALLGRLGSVEAGATAEDSDAVLHCFANVLQFAVAETQPKLFKRASDFNPRMSPALNAEESVLIVHVLNDVARMAEREIQLVRLHFKDSAIGMWERGVRAAEMYALAAGTEVLDEIDARNDGQPVLEEHCRVEDGFVVSLSQSLVVATEVDEVGLLFAVANVGIELMEVILVFEEAVVFVPLVDDPSPGSPSRDAEDGGEEVVVGAVFGGLIDVESADHADSLVVFVAVQHFFAEGEETKAGYVVVFEDDAFVGQ